MIYLELFYIFLKIGAFTFGGGYAMLPLIQDEVIAHNWIDSQSLIDFIAVSESTPGPESFDNQSKYTSSDTIKGILYDFYALKFFKYKRYNKNNQVGWYHNSKCCKQCTPKTTDTKANKSSRINCNWSGS